MCSVCHLIFPKKYLLADALPMANFKYFENGAKIFKRIKQLDDDFPLMVLEFWTGWFDHWGEDHNTFSKEGENFSFYILAVQKVLARSPNASNNSDGRVKNCSY